MNPSSSPLPEHIEELLSALGYKDLFPPQQEAIDRGVLERKNILISTPTASGKTLIALMAALHTIITTGLKVVYLSPLRALAFEKKEEFDQLGIFVKSDGTKIRVLISSGDYDVIDESLGDADIIIVTNEKFDSILRHGVNWLEKVGLFVVDEVHLVGDAYRGPTLEGVLTNILSQAKDAQLIALSATITNDGELAKWLGAERVNSNWRPVPLIEGVYTPGKISFSDGSKREVLTSKRGGPIDAAADVLRDNGQALIFAETRRRSVSFAQKVSEVTEKFLDPADKRELRRISNSILNVGEVTGLSRILAKVVASGAAFHHAGLFPEHRRMIEQAFKARNLKIISATPTLAAGVNLPARRVVIGSLLRYDSEMGGQKPVSILDYKQMSGRAGRPAYDKFGETVIIANNYDEDEIMDTYVNGTPEPIRSKLIKEGPLRTYLLAVISMQPAMNDSDLEFLLRRTLLHIQFSQIEIRIRCQSALEFLQEKGLIEKRKLRYLATEFGRRVSMLYIDPATGVLFREGAKNASKDELIRLLRLIVSSPDFTPKLPLRNKDLDYMMEFLSENKQEPISVSVFDDAMPEMRVVMALHSWINEVKEEDIGDRFGVDPGDIHRAVENCDWLLYSYSEICKISDRADLVTNAGALRKRVKYGIKSELIELVGIEGVGRVRARILYERGYTDRYSVQKASLTTLANIPKIGASLARKLKGQADPSEKFDPGKEA